MNIAVVCASGLGDGLLMQIAARHLRALGHKVTTFSDPLLELREWFPGYELAPRSASLAGFDAVLLEHDNTPFCHDVARLPVQVYTLYASHNVSKHAALSIGRDFVFTRTKPIAHNIADAMQTLFPGVAWSLDNGLRALAHLTKRKFPRRIAIHPTSSSPKRNWPRARFLKLRERLAARGYEPVFVTAPHEADAWDAPRFTTLSEFATFLYESGGFIGNDSGPGHLASNLGLNTVTVGPNLHHHLDLWRPGWSQGFVCTAPSWAMRLKALRPLWGVFISPNQVVKTYEVNHERSCSTLK